MSEADASALLERYSRGEISAIEVRHALGGITFADLLIALAELDLPLPRTAETGREDRLAEARKWLFPKTP